MMAQILVGVLAAVGSLTDIGVGSPIAGTPCEEQQPCCPIYHLGIGPTIDDLAECLKNIEIGGAVERLPKRLEALAEGA